MEFFTISLAKVEQTSSIFLVPIIKKGLIITYVSNKGPANEVGLRPLGQDQFGRYHLGDILLSIDNKETAHEHDHLLYRSFS